MPRNRQTGGTFMQAADLLQSKRPPTPLERQAIAEVHELALRFVLTTVTLQEVRAAVSGNQRRLATQFTPPNHPEYAALMALLDALIAESQQTVVTKQGTFLVSDLWPMRVDGTVLHLPVRQPWRVKPDADRGIDGERGEPIYRSEAGPTIGGFSVVHAAEPLPPLNEWWMDESSDEVPF
jgi:hypothetical protein